MKYSFMSFSCPDLELRPLLALAQRLGYDGIEPRIDSGHHHGIELGASPVARKEARRQAVGSGVSLCCIATSCSYANPSGSAQEVETTRRAIDLAADVGSSRIRVFGGQIPNGMSREAAIDQVAHCLSSVADHAQACGVTVCMETHDDWCRPADVAAVMKRVGRPAIAVNWDIMHPARTAKATIDDAFEALLPWIRHVHFHDGTTGPAFELRPIGRGEIDHRRAVHLLQGAEWDGYLSGEWIDWEPYEIHLPRELAAMRAYEVEALR